MEISIILPNFNGEKSLGCAIQSFLDQGGGGDVPNFELIVVDGKSTDRSHDIIKSFLERSDRLRWVKEADFGISDAFNRGMAFCSGKTIGYLGGDDLLMPGILDRVTALTSMVEVDGIFFNSYTNWVRERKVRLQKPAATDLSRNNLLKYGTLVGLQNIFYKREILINNPLDIRNLYSMDYELLLRLSLLQMKFMYVDEAATINNFDGNISHNNPNQTSEAIRVALRYSKGYSGPFWFDRLLPISEIQRLRSEFGVA